MAICYYACKEYWIKLASPESTTGYKKPDKMIQKYLLKILFVDDVPSDVDLAVLELRKEKLKFEYTTVCTRIDLVKALKEFNPDLIISDYMMPSFNGLQALKETKEFGPEIPFILYTGSVNEEIAVECIKAGAQDYVIKEHSTRLPFAVKEALEQARNNKEKRASELLLRENEEKLQSIFTAAPVGIGLVINRVFMEMNDAFCNMTGYRRSELIGKSSEILYSSTEEFLNVGKEKYRQITEKGTGSVESKLKCKDGKILNVILSSTPLDKNNYSKGVTFTVLDITERKKAEDDLKESHRLINTLISNLQVLVYRCRNDKQFTMEFLSEGAREITGYSPADLLYNSKLSYNDLIHKADRDYVWTEVQKAVKSRKHYQITYRIITKNGEIRWVWEKGEGVFLKSGELEFLEGFIIDITQRKNMEEELRKSRHLFETFAQTSPVGIFRTQPNGFTTYVNPRWLELSGLTAEEATGFGWLKAVHPDDREKLERGWNSDVQSKISSVAEYRFVRRDGSIVWVIGNAVPELIDNEVVDYIGTITDITYRKQAEDRLRNSEERLKILFDYAPDAYYLYDLMGNFVDGNFACEKLVGYNRNELIGKNFLKLSLISSNSLPLAAKLLSLNFLGKGTGPDVLVLNRKDGSLVTIEIITYPVKIKDQTLVLGIARDISERLRTEKTIRESEEKYRVIFENVQDVYYETSVEGTILEVSPSIGILSKGQYRMDDLIGKSIFDFYSDPKERQVILAELGEKGALNDFEITLINRDGSHTPCSISAKLVFDVDGHPEKIIGSIHDITERKNASDVLRLSKEKAEASDKLKTEFLNNISHEVRTPLNGILGFAEIISLQDLSEEEKKDSIAMLFESSNRLLNTITNYMDISLITSGSLSVNKKDFIPAVIIRKISHNFESGCLNKRLELFLEIPEQSDNYFINSDPEICQKIISHFLDNAVKFTEKGSIHFGFNRTDEQIEFFVKDTGIGINLDSFNIIFDRFVKESQGSFKVTEGSGLGLSIAMGMSDAIGGKIRLESEPGVGSCFFLSVPVKKRDEESSPINPAKDSLKTIADSMILVAEDDETNFYYLNALITRETGIKVLHASNGREAIELFKTNPDIKLILMDIKMPEIDGFEATRQIKLINPNVNIIAITAYAMSGDEERIIAAGCDGYLSKPINKKSLLEKIAEFIKIR